MSNQQNPAHSVAIVTGAAQGIGLGITHELLESGWRVAVWDLDEEALAAFEQEQKSRREQVLVQRVDVAQESQVGQAVANVLQHFGRIDGVVNNAGIADPLSGPVHELALADWQRWLNVDLTAPFLLAKHTAEHLRKAHGAIVNIASTRALQSEPNCEAYAAAKGGLVALSHALAVSLSGAVRVNAISPGWIAVEDYKKPAERRTPELTEADHDQHPAGRVGRPGDVAKLCRFLLSDEAEFITGENIVIDGGMTRKMIYQ